MKVKTLIFLLAAAVAPVAPASGDIVYMLDGTTREGLIESHNPNEIQLRVERDGIVGTLTIPMANISRAVINRRATATPRPTPTPALADPQPSPVTASLWTMPTPPKGPDLLVGATVADLIAFRDHGTLEELMRTFAGQGLDDPARLTPAARVLWSRAAHADAAGFTTDALEHLRQLEAGMARYPGGIKRLNAIARRERNESFGVWMGRLHWAVMESTYNGQFDLSDVRDVERPVLVGYLKEKMESALSPLAQLFPPRDEKTGQYAPFRASQLQSITLSNATDMKEKSTYAAAVLLAQIQLEPDMPAIDKGMLYTQLGIVNRIRSRAIELEPVAKAAAIRAEQERRAAEEKARRDAAAAAQKARTAPR